MKSFIMEVSKKESVNGENQYVKQGEVTIFYPLLSEMGIAVDPKEEDKDGFPVYADEKVQFVFDATLAAVKAMARNKLKSGTAELKEGASIADTVEALLESGGNKGEALAAQREMLATFKTFLAKTGKKEAVQAAVYDLARNKTGLALQSAEKKGKFQGYLTDFASSLTAEQSARFSRALISLNEACESGDPLDDM